MRELIYYVAGTADGFIAQEDGSFDGMPWDEAYIADLGASFPETFPVHLREVLSVRGGNKWFDIVLGHSGKITIQERESESRYVFESVSRRIGESGIFSPIPRLFDSPT